MKKFLLLALLLLIPSTSSAAITFNADCRGFSAGIANISCSFAASKPTAGDLVVVLASVYTTLTNAEVLVTPTDNQSGNTYTLVGSLRNWTISGTDSVSTGMYKAENVNVSGTYTVTETPSPSCGTGCNITIIALAFTGVATSSSLDGNPGQQTTGANPTTTAVTTTNANDVLVGEMSNSATSAVTDPAGYTVSPNGKQANNSLDQDLFTAYQIVSATASYAVTWTEASDTYGAQAGFYKQASAGGTPNNLKFFGVGK